MRDEILRIGKICKRAQLHDESAFRSRRPGRDRRFPGGGLAAVAAVGGRRPAAAALAASVGAPVGRIASTSTSPLPFCAMPIRSAAAKLRVDHAAVQEGPAIVDAHDHALAVATLVTVAYDGSGSVGCAAVIAYMS
jgi:hypothetical protein